MNWKKIKTVLIFLFLAIDIFLVIWNITLRHEANVVDKNTIKDTALLLEKRGIKIPEGVIDEEIPSVNGISVRNIMASEAEFVGGILGRKYEKEENVFYNSECSVEINKNTFTIESDIRIKSAEEAAKWLTSLGFDLKDTVKAEHRGEFVIKSVYEGHEIYGSRISVKSEGNKTKAYGSFFYVIEDSETKTDIRHATAVLPRLIQEGIANCSVSSVNIGYRVDNVDSRFAEATATPTYRILLSDGREIFYNATK
ncbi:MAG: hypothetical protein IKL74_01080 [Clostridia bacterium]|nr:hypothetical protein [Clostridia bacterium]